MKQKPQKIVALSVSAEELLLALVGTERMAALTYLADEPGISNIEKAEAEKIPKRIRANAEILLALQPDLVVVPDWLPAELADTLREAGITVYIFATPQTIEQVKDTVAELAKVVGEPAAGQLISKEMDNELAKVKAKIGQIPESEQKVVLRFSFMGATEGKDSLFNDICRQAGVKNAVALTGLNGSDVLAKEQIVQLNPDIFILPMWDYSGKNDINRFREEVRSDPALQTVKAVRENQLFPLPDRYLFCSSQSIVYGVREMAKAAYPQLFREE